MRRATSGTNPLIMAIRLPRRGAATSSSRRCYTGAEPKQLNELGMNALGRLHVQLRRAATKTHKFCRWLIDHGADVNNVDKGGHTASN